MEQATQKSSIWLKCISTSGSIRGVVIHSTEIVRELTRQHSIAAENARGLGEAATAGLLLASYCKPGERINLNIQGSKRFKQALVDAHPEGTLRGYVVTQDEFLPQKETGPWGTGFLSVLRTKELERKQPYIGTVPLLTGHLAKDFAFYWAQSEQVPTACGVSVAMKNGEVVAAGGFMVQAMPGATQEELKMIDDQVQRLTHLEAKFDENFEPVRFLSDIFENVPFIVLEEKPLKLECNCSWERVERALALVGVQELRSMMTEDQGASVRCDFCSKEYKLTVEQLEALIPKG